MSDPTALKDPDHALRFFRSLRLVKMTAWSFSVIGKRQDTAPVLRPQYCFDIVENVSALAHRLDHLGNARLTRSTLSRFNENKPYNLSTYMKCFYRFAHALSEQKVLVMAGSCGNSRSILVIHLRTLFFGDAMLLYKYRPFDVNTLKIIERTTVYYADPEKFNDPLDCNPGIESCSSKTRLEAVLKSFYSSDDEEQRADFVRMIKDHKYHSTNPEHGGDTSTGRDRNYCFALLAEIKDKVKHYFNETGVLSMAKSHSNMLMWSHYGANHRGVCIGYNVNQRSEDKAFKARYDLPRIIPFDLIEEWRIKKSKKAKKLVKTHFFLTKSKEWDYEDEYRFLRAPQGKTSGIGATQAPFDIAEVIFGLKCDVSVMVAIIRVLQDATPRVKFYEMTTLSDGFDLQRRTLDPEDLLRGSPGPSMLQLAKDFEGF